MNTRAFTRIAGEQAVAAWRALDRMVYRWVVARGGDPRLAEVAAWASLAEGAGDAALALDSGREGFVPLGDAEIAALRASPLVAGEGEDEAGPRPFMLDRAGRFYLWRNHVHERVAARAIRERRAAARAPQEGAAAKADLDLLFGGVDDARVAAQRAAVCQAPGKRLFILTGGPGTGKTTTVLRMLLMLGRRADGPLRIQLAAPTGKAAQRLMQAIRRGKAELGERLPPDWKPLLEAVPDSEALTVHRLLRYQPWRNAFARSARDPLPADVVVIDEASMLDLAMLRHLLEALRPEASLVLVGDADQLTSVATGSVLRDLVGAFEEAPADDLVRLEHSFRAETELVAINAAVRAGDPAALDAALAAAGDAALRREVRDEQGLHAELERWVRKIVAADGLRPRLPVLAAGGEDAAARAEATELARKALAALGERQLLAALREGDFGALAINAWIEAALRRAWDIPPGAEWYPGRAVIVTRNDHAAGLFNGDVGLCLADAAGRLRVWFEAPEDAAEAGGLRSFAPRALPACETAFALTIHKSQGSEYREVAVFLPPEAEHRILSRQLLYTGLSRAKQALRLWATPEALARALATEVDRRGGLAERVLAERP